MLGPDLTTFVVVYGIWVVAAFIALESIGIPLPAEATLMAAAFFASRTPDFSIWILISAGVVAVLIGEISGFWIGRLFGRRLITKYGPRVGVTPQRLRIGEWLFAGYGGRFVFIARFLPVLRNMAAVLAGANRMPFFRFYFAAGTAGVAWVMFYGLAAFYFGEAFRNLASSAAGSLACVAVVIVLGLPTLLLRYERRLLAKADLESPVRPQAQ